MISIREQIVERVETVRKVDDLSPTDDKLYDLDKNR